MVRRWRTDLRVASDENDTMNITNSCVCAVLQAQLHFGYKPLHSFQAVRFSRSSVSLMLTVETYASQITEDAQTKTTQQADTAGSADG